MKKKLAIFCDGTWNDLTHDATTNVVRLAKSVASVSRGGDPQIVYYDEGVGVAANVSVVADTLTKFLGGALGRGLDRKIEAAYRFLVLNYEPGDDVYVFGFSRGAYTARSLCGLIRKCGILKRECFNRTPRALELYRDKSLHPSSPEMKQFRAQYAHHLAAGEEDFDRIGIEPAESSQAATIAQNPETLEDLYQYRPKNMYRMMYVGVWDTVGAMGVPARFDWLKLNRRYAFHDTDASTLLASIRHAVAGNEKRGLFDVTPISNIDELNLKWAARTGWNTSDSPDPRFVPYPFRPYQQRWFPGDHCSVGGGYSDSGLSSGALLWIAEGAARAGLAFSWDPLGELGAARRLANPMGDIGGNGTFGMPAGELRQRGPAHIGEIADATYERYERAGGYRPPNLSVLLGAPLPRPPAPAAPPGFPTI